jgi:tRNA (guanine-N7-)-methyltransferase
VEIGFGLGDFLVRNAKKYRGENFLGVEIGWVPIRRTLRKIALSGVSNIRLIRAEAEVAFERLIRPKSVDHIYSLFPCPWPKKKHLKNRLFSKYFLQLLNSRLVTSGEVFIVTDHHEYFKWIQSQTPGTGMDLDSGLVAPGLKTKYEKKWTGMGQKKFFRLRLMKKEHIEIPLKEDIALRTHRSKYFDPGSFSPSGIKGDIVVEFKKFLFDAESKTGMARCIVCEGNLVQDFWIEIAMGEKFWHIRPAKGCGLIPTLGAQRALDLVFDAL